MINATNDPRRRRHRSKHITKSVTNDMADVEMTDAAAAPKVKSSKATASTDMEGKKRFEVKKVRQTNTSIPSSGRTKY